MKTTDIVLYGISNCDTVRKALAWCEAHSVPYRFHDFKKLGVPAHEELRAWLTALGTDALINKRGTTWRNLTEADRANYTNGAHWIALMQAHPSIIKRPVVDWGVMAPQRLTAGFDALAWGRQAGITGV